MKEKNEMAGEYEIILCTVIKCSEAVKLAGAYGGVFKQGFDVTTITHEVATESLRQATEQALAHVDFLAGLGVIVHRIEVG